MSKASAKTLSRASRYGRNPHPSKLTHPTRTAQRPPGPAAPEVPRLPHCIRGQASVSSASPPKRRHVGRTSRPKRLEGRHDPHPVQAHVPPLNLGGTRCPQPRDAKPAPAAVEPPNPQNANRWIRRCRLRRRRRRRAQGREVHAKVAVQWFNSRPAASGFAAKVVAPASPLRWRRTDLSGRRRGRRRSSTVGTHHSQPGRPDATTHRAHRRRASDVINDETLAYGASVRWPAMCHTNSAA